MFDTQAAAALCGLGAGLGYQKLVQQVEGVELAKGETRSDWLRRPLSPSQLEYAADDVLHLHALHAALDARMVAVDTQRQTFVLALLKTLTPNCPAGRRFNGRFWREGDDVTTFIFC